MYVYPYRFIQINQVIAKNSNKFISIIVYGFWHKLQLKQTLKDRDKFEIPAKQQF